MAQQWATDLETKYGMPLDQIPGKVYVLPEVFSSAQAPASELTTTAVAACGPRR